jgi:hypothetical protein
MKRRPVLFASAAAVGLWSAWIVLHGAPDRTTRVVAATVSRAPAGATGGAPVTATGGAPVTAAAAAPDATPAPRPRLEASPGDDTFASREWFKPAPPPPPPPPAPAPPPPPPAPPPPPTLPYRFVGMLDEGAVARPRVFLSLGDKLLVAGVGDTLEGGYRLVAISGQELVFTHVQNNVTLKLAVAGGTS